MTRSKRIKKKTETALEKKIEKLSGEPVNEYLDIDKIPQNLVKTIRIPCDHVMVLISADS